jgi:hypothetical protein
MERRKKDLRRFRFNQAKPRPSALLTSGIIITIRAYLPHNPDLVLMAF